MKMTLCKFCIVVFIKTINYNTMLHNQNVLYLGYIPVHQKLPSMWRSSDELGKQLFPVSVNQRLCKFIKNRKILLC